MPRSRAAPRARVVSGPSTLHRHLRGRGSKPHAVFRQYWIRLTERSISSLVPREKTLRPCNPCIGAREILHDDRDCSRIVNRCVRGGPRVRLRHLHANDPSRSATGGHAPRGLHAQYPHGCLLRCGANVGPTSTPSNPERFRRVRQRQTDADRTASTGSRSTRLCTHFVTSARTIVERFPASAR